MSGFARSEKCPHCGTEDSLEVSQESRDRGQNYAYCLECGYHEHTVVSIMSLYEVNEERALLGIFPLTELKKEA